VAVTVCAAAAGALVAGSEAAGADAAGALAADWSDVSGALAAGRSDVSGALAAGCSEASSLPRERVLVLVVARALRHGPGRHGRRDRERGPERGEAAAERSHDGAP
jgi:hypothetical protein